MLSTVLGSVILALLLGPTAANLVADATVQECHVSVELGRSARPGTGQTDQADQALGRQLAERPDDADTILASRVYRRNKSSLLACDKLAERRGERLDGRRATFLVEVDRSGTPTVAIDGHGLGPRLLSCYYAVAHHWELPATGSAYATSFVHVR